MVEVWGVPAPKINDGKLGNEKMDEENPELPVTMIKVKVDTLVLVPYLKLKIQIGNR